VDGPGAITTDIVITLIIAVKTTVLATDMAVRLDLAREEKWSLSFCIMAVDNKLDGRVCSNTACEGAIAVERLINQELSLNIPAMLSDLLERHSRIDTPIHVVNSPEIIGSQ